MCQLRRAISARGLPCLSSRHTRPEMSPDTLIQQAARQPHFINLFHHEPSMVNSPTTLAYSTFPDARTQKPFFLHYYYYYSWSIYANNMHNSAKTCFKQRKSKRLVDNQHSEATSSVTNTKKNAATRRPHRSQTTPGQPGLVQVNWGLPGLSGSSFRLIVPACSSPSYSCR